MRKTIFIIGIFIYLGVSLPYAYYYGHGLVAQITSFSIVPFLITICTLAEFCTKIIHSPKDNAPSTLRGLIHIKLCWAIICLAILYPAYLKDAQSLTILLYSLTLLLTAGFGEYYIVTMFNNGQDHAGDNKYHES